MAEDTPPAAVSPPPARAGFNRRHLVIGLVLALIIWLVLLVAGLTALWWGARTESGAAWLLAHTPGLQADQPQGALLGDFSARRLSVTVPGVAEPLVLTGLRWQGLSLDYSPHKGQWLRLRIATLQADRIDLSVPASTSGSSPAPTSLGLPLELDLPSVRVGEFHTAALGAKPLRALDASLHLGADAGAQHRLVLRHLEWDQLQLSGEATQASRGELLLNAKLQAQPLPTAPDTRWSARLQLNGPLAAPALQAQLDAAQQSLQATAGLRPFEPWPLATLQASTSGLNLAALNSDWPQTALSGDARIKSTGWDQAAQVSLQLRNAAAGRWDQQRLPLRSATVDLQVKPSQAQRLEVRAFDIQLGSDSAPAGRLQGDGGGQMDAWELATRISDLQTARLDQAAAPLRLNGTLKLKGSGGTQSPKVDILAALQGQMQPAALAQKPGPKGGRALAAAPAGNPVNAEIKVDVSYTPQLIELRQLRLVTGTASATAQARLSPQGKAWRVAGSGALKDFDPRLLWAGPAGSAWQRGPHRVNAQFEADLLTGAPASASTASTTAWPQGQASIKLGDSVLMGVPLTGDAQLRGDAGKPAMLSARLALDGNQLSLEGQMSANADQRWTGKLQAPELARLAPLLALMPARTAPTLSGKLDADFTAQGRWPQMTLEARVRAQDVATNAPGAPLRIGKAELTAKLGTQAADPLQLLLDAQDLALDGSTVSRLKAQGSGRWQDHQLSVELASGLKAPVWLNAMLPGGSAANAAAQTGSLAQLKLQGSLSPAPAVFLAQPQAVEWKGVLQNLELRGQTQVIQNGKPPPAWVSARDLGFALQWDGNGRLAQTQLQPGRVDVAGAGVRWNQLRWLPPGAQAPQLAVQIELEPLAVAPLLARWQPDFGWGGDLVMGGRVQLRMGAEVDIDIELQRSKGDLMVTDDAGQQRLGLSELRLGLTAQHGVWHFTQAVAGSNLGVVGGAITTRTSPQAWWPAPEAPLEGVMEAQVANLGTWGAWVPAGWRVAGTMRAGLTLGGRVGAPEITGQASGQALSVRNLLEGVDVREGEFLMSLNGPTAKLERFSAKAGAGTVKMEGSATFGAAPQAQLQLVASKFTLLGRVDRRIVTTGNAQLALKANDLKLGGQFTVDEGLIDFTRSDAPSLDEDVIVVRTDQPPPEPAAAGPKRERVVQIDLAVDLGQNLRLKGRGLDTALRGQLHLNQVAGKPALTGTVRAEGGTYAAYGQKLEIERGEVIFSGVIDNPRLDVIATRPNTDTRVGVSVTGTARNPRIRLFSEPEMSETDKLSWLILGRGPDGLGRTDTALLQRAALALLSGEGEGASGKIIRNLGLDELSLKQSEGDVKETIVRLGKQISRRWYVGYERGLSSTTGNWQLIYRIAQRFTLRAQSGSDNSLDVIWQWKWD